MWLNGARVLPALGTAPALPPPRAVSGKLPATGRGGRGLVLDFQAQTGETILNGLQVKRLY